MIDHIQARDVICVIGVQILSFATGCHLGYQAGRRGDPRLWVNHVSGRGFIMGGSLISLGGTRSCLVGGGIAIAVGAMILLEPLPADHAVRELCRTESWRGA